MGGSKSTPVKGVKPGEVGTTSSPAQAKKTRIEVDEYGMCAAANLMIRDRNENTLAGALAFVPWIVQQAYRDGTLLSEGIVKHRGDGAVVFSDASGFTALTERLATKSNGAELLSQCLTAFFTPLIDIIVAYRGDVIKFSGDALTCYYPAVDDNAQQRANEAVPPCGTFACRGHTPMELSCLRASASCIEIHKRLHMFDTGVDGVKLCLHIGVGCGNVTILQVGGVIPPETSVPRFEYVVAGPPIEQISIAEPLAANGETCLSPQVWEHVKHTVVEGPPVKDRPDFHLLARMDERKHTFPTLKNASMEADQRHKYRFELKELDLLRRYIPAAVFKQIQGGTLKYVNEMRNMSVIFIQVAGVDVSSDEGSKVAEELMTGVQRITYSYEGTVNKFLVDDKGLLFLLVYGLPPMVHMDDPTRAVLSCFDMVQLFSRMNLGGRFGVTTGRSYCGICGSESRMEYTVLGDTVNLSARLMANAAPLGILVDETTHNLAGREISFQTLTPIKVKGKTSAIPIFAPLPRETPAHIGLGMDMNVSFPWRCSSAFLGGDSKLCELRSWMEIIFVQRLMGETNKPLPQRGHSVRMLETHHDNQGDVTVDDKLFSNGGILVLCGPIGLGKTELCEYVVANSVRRFTMAPVFGTVGPRPGEQLRPVRELLKSTLAALRHVDASLPADDREALSRLAPSELANSLPRLGPLLAGEPTNRDEEDVTFEKGLDLAVVLLKKLLEKRAVLAALILDTGTNLYEKTSTKDNACFWRLVDKLSAVAMANNGQQNQKSLVVIINCREPNQDDKAVKYAAQHGWYIETHPLSDEGITECMSKCLDVREQQIPKLLQQFVTKITLGNPLYIRETTDQLIQHGHVEVFRDSKTGASEGLYCNQDLESITIADWAHTAMVGRTICLLESLDPLDAAVVKMSTVFQNCFNMADLIASGMSRWSGSTRLDALRLYNAVQKVVSLGIVEAISNPTREELAAFEGDSELYRLDNVLIRKVAGAMVLEEQKKAVKRQALVERVLAKKLPAQMLELNRKKAIPHIPWYYQIHDGHRRGTGILGS